MDLPCDPSVDSRGPRIGRRGLLAGALAAALGGSARGAGNAVAGRVLLRSSWQTANIGDIAHTPGVLRILEEHLPDVQVTLWPSNVDNGVKELLAARFPRLRFALNEDQLARAFDECDLLLHSSGPSLVAEGDVVRWRQATGKPYGVYGITLPAKPSTATRRTPPERLAKTIGVLSGARFVFFRDSPSLELAKRLGCAAPVMAFGPDGAFACDLRDDAQAVAFLAQHGLDPGGYLCCIPRLRYTPYWTLHGGSVDPVKHARNEQMKQRDHAPLREAIVQTVRQTDLKVLVCPEDRTQMRVGKEMLIDRLPADVLPRVVWRPDYWLTGEAISTYVRSAGLFGAEMHSPIMCVGHGVPAVVCRFAEQTTKGLMWRDIGLDDWLFDLDDPADAARVAPTVLQIAKDPAAARAKANAAQARVAKLQSQAMGVLRGALG